MPAVTYEAVHEDRASQFAAKPDTIGVFTIGQGGLIAQVDPDRLDDLRPTEPLTPTEQEVFVRASFGDTIETAVKNTHLSRETVELARDRIVAKYGVRKRKLAPAISNAILAEDLAIDAPSLSKPKLLEVGRSKLTLIASILHGSNDRFTAKHLGIPVRYVSSRKNELFSMLGISGENALPRTVYEEMGLVAIVHTSSDS